MCKRFSVQLYVTQLCRLCPFVCVLLLFISGVANAQTTWPRFRGENADGQVASFPDSSFTPRLLWQIPMPAQGIGGVAANKDFVIASSRTADDKADLFVCVDPTTGAELWRLEYAAPGELDYGNSPRATPLINDPHVFLVGAFGDIHCVDIDLGEVLWRTHLVRDLGGELPTWGYGWSPLLIKNQLVVLPGGKECAIAALNADSGKLLWRTVGEPAAYASPQLVEWHGKQQIIAYDRDSLSGWDPVDGKKLWSIFPPVKGDFNVPMPIALRDQLFTVTENNGARLYQVTPQGKLETAPWAQTMSVTPDANSPVLVGSQIVVADKHLWGLNADAELSIAWQIKDRAFRNHTSLIAADNQLLAITQGGEVLLIRTSGSQAEIEGRHTFGADAKYILSHPALVENVLYLRAERSLQAWSLW